MNDLTTTHWRFLHGQPQCTGTLKAKAEDFLVEEILGFEPSGEGEHLFLWVEKRNLNTAFVAEQIARFCQLPLRAVSYAGRKDKHAVTRQWFGVHAPGKVEFDWSGWALEGAQVLHYKRHNKKLKIGSLKGNRFILRISQLANLNDLPQRIEQVAQYGVPNYFGQQRFGDTRHDPKGGNLVLASKMLQGETIRNRNKRSMAISALRSWMFNEFVHQRIEREYFDAPCLGDVCILSGSNSFFCAEQIDQTLLSRLEQGDVQLSAPMWGQGQLNSKYQALELEQSIASPLQDISRTLEGLGLNQERRPIKLMPANLHWQLQENTLNIEFDLPAGCFATSVVRELISVDG